MDEDPDSGTVKSVDSVNIIPTLKLPQNPLPCTHSSPVACRAWAITRGEVNMDTFKAIEEIDRFGPKVPKEWIIVNGTKLTHNDRYRPHNAGQRISSAPLGGYLSIGARDWYPACVSRFLHG